MSSPKLLISALYDARGRKTKVRAGDSIIYAQKANTIMLARNNQRGGNRLLLRAAADKKGEDKISFDPGFSAHSFIEFAQLLAACLGMALLTVTDTAQPDIVHFVFAEATPMKPWPIKRG